MQFVKSIKHFIFVHKKEVIYFFLIYLFAIIPGLFGFEIVRRLLHTQKSLMLLFLIMPTIPVCVYTEYSYRKLGYKKPIAAALNTFILLNFLLILLLNLDTKFLPPIYNILLVVLGILIGGGGYYFVKDDSCNCRKTEETFI